MREEEETDTMRLNSEIACRKRSLVETANEERVKHLLAPHVSVHTQERK